MSSSAGNRKIRYSGLETKGIKQMDTSLLLPEDPEVQCSMIWLEKQTVSVKMDYGAPHSSVAFPGAGAMALMIQDRANAAVPDNKRQPPKVMAIAGRCKYTKLCYKDFPS